MQPIPLLLKQFISRFWPGYGGNKSRNGILEKTIRAYFHGRGIKFYEKSGLQDIENIRESLLHSDASMVVQEFGAGSNLKKNTSSNSEKVKHVCRISSKAKSSCRFLYHIICYQKPKNILEMGTCLGISTAYLTRALCHNRTVGTVYTLEGSTERLSVARKNLEKLGVDIRVEFVQGKFNDTLEPLLTTIKKVDFAFIDGHHDEQATIQYFNQILPHIKKGGIMVFDDIFWSAGMNRAWSIIKSSEAVKEYCAFKGMGVLAI